MITTMMDDVTLGNVIRYSCIFLEFTIIAMTSKIVYVYYRAYRVHRGEARGLLPHHVWMIGLSYIFLSLATTSYQLELIDTHPTWRSILVLIALFFGVTALFQMLSYQNLKLKTPPERIEDDEL